MVYLADVQLSGSLLIADDSLPDAYQANAAFVRRAQSAISVRHLQIERGSLFNKIRQALAVVDTPYVVMAADDDFIVPDALAECASFLDSHPEYSLAHGRALQFQLDRIGGYGEIALLSECPQASLEQMAAAERLVSHLKSYAPTWYSVERTRNLRQSWHQLGDLQDWRFVELTMSSLAVIRGKTRRLSSLYMIRQDNPLSVSGKDTATEMDWLTSPNWAADYATVSAALATEIASVDGISTDVAKAVVDKAFWAYLATQLQRRWQHVHAEPITDYDSRTVWTDLGLRALRRVRSVMSRPLGPDRTKVDAKKVMNLGLPDRAKFQHVQRSLRRGIQPRTHAG